MNFAVSGLLFVAPFPQHPSVHKEGRWPVPSETSTRGALCLETPSGLHSLQPAQSPSKKKVDSVHFQWLLQPYLRGPETQLSLSILSEFSDQPHKRTGRVWTLKPCFYVKNTRISVEQQAGVQALDPITLSVYSLLLFVE
uniref:Putative mule transposase domain protein n=1 Tax=Ixodes ricinus TaxID=34613 RepID=A0A0K8RMY2_IXORI